MTENSSPPISSTGFEYGVKHFYNENAGVLSEILFSTLQMEPEKSRELLNLGAIYVNNQRQRTDVEIAAGQLCRVHTKPRRYDCTPDWSSLVVFENSDFLVLNKPSGIPSHPSVDNFIENSLTQTARARGCDLFITHRLDTLTAGLIVYAKTNEFVRHFNQQLKDQNTEKKYVALVEGSKELPRRVIHYMEPNPRSPKKLSASFQEGWAFCELEILEQKVRGGNSWLRINLLTGRTHQIRSQLSELGSPIMGDRLYGSICDFKPNAIALRAYELRFNWGRERIVLSINDDFDV